VVFAIITLALAFTTKELLNPSTQKIEPIITSTRSQKNLILVGDSYARTIYLQNSFPKIFDSIAKKHNYNFINYTQSGSEFHDHAKLINSSITASNEENIVVYFYNIGDIIDFRNPKKETLKSIKKNPSTSSNQNHSTVLFSVSRSIKEVFDISKGMYQHLHVKVDGYPTKSSDLYMFAKTDYELYGKDLEQSMSTWSNKGKRIIFVVTYPFNYEIDEMKNWYVYQYFSTLKNKNIEVYQSIDMLEEIKDKDLSISWRNGHPNQETVDSLAKKVNEILWTK
jgi:hypothetical protein